MAVRYKKGRMRRLALVALVLAVPASAPPPAVAAPTGATASARPTLYLNTSGRPRGVSAVRLRHLVRKSARRWRLGYGGLTSRSPGRDDGVNVAGFSRRLPRAVGGATLVTATYVDGRLASR